MHSVPFRLLVVDELDLRAVRSDRHNWNPPGVVEESFECQPLWKSKPNSTYPQELGLILLSPQPVTIKSLRLTVKLDRAPAQVVIFVALPARRGLTHATNSIDTVSWYLSADWKQCCEPLAWALSTSAMLNTAREVDSRTVRLDIPECSFIKLVVDAPYQSPLNQSHQVVLEDIELQGSGKHLILAHQPNQKLYTARDDDDKAAHDFDPNNLPVLLPSTTDNDELQTILLEAGVPLDLVVQIANISKDQVDFLSPVRQQHKPPANNADKIVPDTNSRDNVLVTLSNATKHASSNQDKEDKETASPFDGALRQYVGQIARERVMLDEILAAEASKYVDELTSWQSPTISSDDPANSNEITLYTFGTFFTQCLLCGGIDIQVACVQIAERVAPLLTKVIGATSAFEGIIALIVLGVREAKSFQVFQATIHLAHTAFLTEKTHVKKAADQPLGRSSLGLIEEVGCANWSYGLRTILEWILGNPLCWSISHNGKPTKTIPHKYKVVDFTKAQPSIDREFLQFVRLLIKQDATRTIFFDELLNLTPTAIGLGVVVGRNRLRLIRLVLRNEIIRCQLSTNVKTSIRTLCTNILSPEICTDHQTLLEPDGALVQLAADCLDEIDRPAQENAKRTILLTSVRSLLETSNSRNNYHSHQSYHTAIFIRDPLSDTEAAYFSAQLQLYFLSQPRPNALYRHSFVHGSQQSFQIEETKSHQLLQKGNIFFQGQVVPRIPPTRSFHDEIQRNTAPFVFDIGNPTNNKSATTPSPKFAGPQQIVSSFAAFRGTLERRSDSSARSSKILPEQRLPDVSATANATNRKPGPAVVNSPVAKDPILDPQIVITTPVHGVISAVNDPPVSNLVVTKQESQNAEDAKCMTDINKSNHHKSNTKTKGAEKTKGNGTVKANEKSKKNEKTKVNETTKTKGKHDGEDSDNCVLQ